MTNTTHTPGPWKLESNFLNIEVGFTVKGHDNRSIVACAATVNRPGKEKAANAHLIAAAPEMLAALKKAEALIASECYMDSSNECCLYTIREAIAKAEGR